MPKPKQILPVHIQPKIQWKILKGRRRMNITPYAIIKYDIEGIKKLLSNG